MYVRVVVWCDFCFVLEGLVCPLVVDDDDDAQSNLSFSLFFLVDGRVASSTCSQKRAFVFAVSFFRSFVLLLAFLCFSRLTGARCRFVRGMSYRYQVSGVFFFFFFFFYVHDRDLIIKNETARGCGRAHAAGVCLFDLRATAPLIYSCFKARLLLVSVRTPHSPLGVDDAQSITRMQSKK